MTTKEKNAFLSTVLQLDRKALVNLIAIQYAEIAQYEAYIVRDTEKQRNVLGELKIRWLKDLIASHNRQIVNAKQKIKMLKIQLKEDAQKAQLSIVF